MRAEMEIGKLFTARTNELKHLHALLATLKPKPVLIVGLRGMGKTAFLHMYQHHFKHEYAGTTFISGQQILSVSAFLPYLLYRIAADNKLPLDTPHAALSYISALKKKYLIIVDDADAITQRELLKDPSSFQRLGPNVLFVFSSSVLPFHSAPFSLLLLQTLSNAEITDLLRKRIKAFGGNEPDLDSFLSTVHSLNIEYRELSPRFIIQLLDYYLKGVNLQDALERVRSQYFISPSHLIISEVEGRLAALLTIEQSPVGVMSDSGVLLESVPFIIIPNIRYHWHREIIEFEAMLNDPETPESAYQQYFETYPHYLKGIEYKAIYPHIALERDQGDGDLIPDFLLQPITSKFVDVLDLKLPTEKLVVGTENRKKLSQSVHDAVAQVREYRDYFENNNYRELISQKYGITSYRPKAIVVIGRKPIEITEEKMRQITSDLPSHLSIVTYDDLYEKMKTMADTYKI
jgi:hypothetical protein